MIEVSQLWIYPVKSCAPVAVDRLQFDEKGPCPDRRWMVVDLEGRFVTQREKPQMALLQPRLQGNEWVLQAPSGAQLELKTSGTTCQVSVWKDSVEGLDLGYEATRFLKSELGLDGHLIYISPDQHRPISSSYSAAYASLSFADAMPILMVSEESVQDLNARLETPIDLLRFRPNVVVRGTEPHGEDIWSEVQVGEMLWRASKRCSRCVITTIDQKTAEAKGPEPLKTLAQYRREGSKVFFGQYFIHEGQGAVEVGASLQIKN